MGLSPDFVKSKKGRMFVTIIVFIPVSMYVTAYLKVRAKYFVEYSFHFTIS